MGNSQKSGIYAAVAKLDAIECRLWDEPLTRDAIERALKEEELNAVVRSRHSAHTQHKAA